MPAGKRDTSVSSTAGARKRASTAAKKTSTRAQAVAKKGRADRGGMTRHEKSMRDSAIIAAVHAGQALRQIAEEFEITQRSVQRIITDFSVTPSPLDKQPTQLIDELVRIRRRQIADFAKVAAAMAERNPSVSLGAMKAAADALDSYAELLARVGKLPTNLEVFRGESEMRQIARQMAEAVRRAEAGEIAPYELGEIFDRLARPGAGLWDADAQATELEPGDEPA